MKNRWSNGRALNATATSSSPQTTASSSTANRSASAVRSASPVRGVISDILIMTRFPAAIAAIAGCTESATGKFQGEMMPTTPSGVGSTQACTPAARMYLGCGRCGAIHARRLRLVALISSSWRRTSPASAPLSGRLPKSALIARTMRSACSARAAPSRSSRSARRAREGGRTPTAHGAAVRAPRRPGRPSTGASPPGDRSHVRRRIRIGSPHDDALSRGAAPTAIFGEWNRVLRSFRHRLADASWPTMSSAMSTSMSSWPPTRPRRPASMSSDRTPMP